MTKLATVIAALVLVTGMAAAQPSDLPKPGQTPGDLFYGLERASESLELAVASAPIIGSEELAAKVRANHAAERLAEAKELAERNRTEKVEKLMQEYSDQMNRSVQAARKSGKPGFAQRLKNVSRDQVQVLEQVRDRVPEQARRGVDKAIENSQRNQQELDLPPQAKGPGNGSKRLETGNKGVEITVEDKPGRKPSNPGSSGKEGKESGRIDLGKLPTRNPGSDGGEKEDDTESTGTTGKITGQGSETTEEPGTNGSLP